jgi:flavin reductase (DIM6/NTAB) family NADH-FMN oxidoreductase RutF
VSAPDAPDAAPAAADATAAAAADDELDRQRRRVLWALPTGLYLIGSRHGDDVNLMTANLVVQVCMEPKLVGVAIEHESVTAGLVTAGGGFTVSLLARTDREVVRRFVKPVKEVERGPDGTVLGLSGRPVTEVGPNRLPVLASAVGYLDCALTSSEPFGSHLFCVGEVTGVGGEPAEVLRMEDTRMHYGG